VNNIRAVPPLRGLTQKLLTFITIVFINFYKTPNGHFLAALKKRFLEVTINENLAKHIRKMLGID